MDKDYIIFQENGLYGAKDQSGSVVIEPQYKEMYPFSCGLSLVQDKQLRYIIIMMKQKIGVIPMVMNVHIMMAGTGLM